MLELMIDELKKCENETALSLIKLSEIKMKIAEVCGMEENNKIGTIKEIPFAAYEMQLERNLEEKKEIEERHLQEKKEMREYFEKEKDKMRKSHKRVVAWLSGIMIAFIVALFGTIIWFFSTYDFATVTQDDAGINNYAYNTNQGDLIYEPESKADNT